MSIRVQRCNAHLIVPFVEQLEVEEIAPANTRTLRDIIDDHFSQLKCDLAVMLDLNPLTIVCHELEGSGHPKMLQTTPSSKDVGGGIWRF